MSFFSPSPTAPTPLDPSTFRARAIALFDWIRGTMIDEMETLNTEVKAAAAALTLNSVNDSSVTSNTIGTGTKTFTVSPSKSYVAGMWVGIADSAAPTTNSMIGQVSSYGGTTLVVSVPANGVYGSGTKTDWTISLASAPSSQVSGAMLPVISAASLAAGRTALEVPSSVAVTAEIAAALPPQLRSIVASVAANALTLTLNPTKIDFRSTTATDGTPTTVTLASANSIVVPSGATLGTTNSVSARLVLLAINNAGAIEAAVVNMAGGVNLDETGTINTTALGTGSDSANVVYSTTARTGVAYRVVGFIDISETTAGTWATAPTLVVAAGGGAFGAMLSAGFGQTWQSVTGSRSAGTTYYNTTGRPIYIVVASSQSSSGTLGITVSGVALGTTSVPTIGSTHVNSALIPAGASYSVTSSNTITAWSELR